MAFYSIQEHFIRKIRAKFGHLDLPQSVVIRKNSDGSISDLPISDQYLIKKIVIIPEPMWYWQNDIDMKLGPVTKLDKRNKTTSKEIDDNVITLNCDVIGIFPFYGQFGAIEKPASRRIVCKIYIFSNSNLLSY